MAGNQAKKDVAYEYQAIAAERLAWVMRPVFFFSIIAWVLSPGTVRPNGLDHNTLLGFLLGALFGIVLNYGVLKHYLVVRRKDTKNRKNRMPDEYYFGKVMDVLQKSE